MALLCGNDIITANPVIAAAAVAKVRIFLRKRDTFACFITRGFDVKALSVHRSANGFNPINRLVNILNNFIYADNHNNLTWTVNNAGNTV